MERAIYGPTGEVVRRIVNAGRAANTVYVDEDSRRTLVRSVVDAEPALNLAHQMRVGDMGTEIPGGRCVGHMPINDYHKLIKDARLASRNGEGTFAQCRAKRMRAYFQERPRLKV